MKKREGGRILAGEFTGRKEFAKMGHENSTSNPKNAGIPSAHSGNRATQKKPPSWALTMSLNQKFLLGEYFPNSRRMNLLHMGP